MGRDKRRIEVSTTGIDEALQGLTSDPIGLALPQTLGLRIPPALPGYTTPQAQPRYRFCLASRTINGSTRIVGIRQGVTLGVDANFGSPPLRPIEMPVVTPGFKFPDGNISWHLVQETVGRRVTQQPLTNGPGWSFLETDASAMLYKSATFAAGTFDPLTGAPYYYNIGLQTYAPPPTTLDWLPIGGLGNLHDLRFSWYGSQWGSIDELVTGTTRISLYADVLQTNPATRNALPTPPASPWIAPQLTPEEAFIAGWTESGEGPSKGPIYWRIYGSIIFEDDIDAQADTGAPEDTRAV